MPAPPKTFTQFDDLPKEVRTIAKQCAQRHGLKPSEIISDYADRAVVECRAEVFYRLNSAKKMSIRGIAKLFGRSRSVVQAGILRHKRLRFLARQGAFA